MEGRGVVREDRLHGKDAIGKAFFHICCGLLNMGSPEILKAMELL